MVPISPTTHQSPIDWHLSIYPNCRIPPLWALNWLLGGSQGVSKREVETNADSSPCIQCNQNDSWEGLGYKTETRLETRVWNWRVLLVLKLVIEILINSSEPSCGSEGSFKNG